MGSVRVIVRGTADVAVSLLAVFVLVEELVVVTKVEGDAVAAFPLATAVRWDRVAKLASQVGVKLGNCC